MNDILDAISARIKAPWFGYSALAFIALNWRGLFLLMTTEASPQLRLAAFDAETSTKSLIILPILTGALVAATTPWIRWFFGLISKRPFELIDNLQLHSEHIKTIRKTQLEQSRADFFATREMELIDRARRDEKVSEIANDEVKERLISELESLRHQRDRAAHSLGDEPTEVHLSQPEIDILKAAASSRDGSIIRNEYMDGRTLQAGTVTLGAEGAREFMKYDLALRQLIAKQLVEQTGTAGVMFELTHFGWQMAESFR